ncbi:MAG: carboxymuconolactone decarboxylase family protein [Alphaproteobacteria bacterium]
MTMRIDYGAVAPDTVKALYATNRYLDVGHIDPALRRYVELRVSQINGCNYCIWLHGKQARELGEPEDRIAGIAEWRNSDCYSPAERAALAWTESVTNITGGTPPESEFADLKAHFSDIEIVDLTVTAANMSALNRVGISFCLEPPE